MKGEGDIKHKIKEILRALKKDKELQNSLEKFTSADYKNREEFEKEIQELFGTETKEEALKLYLQLKDFYQANLKVLFSDIKDKKFENLNQNLEKFNEEILKEFRETELYKEGFEIITAYDISTVEPNKNCWNEGFVLNDVLHDLDARRKITNDVEKALENKDVIVRGESGFGKSTFFYRIIADFIDKGYTIIYKENGGDLKHPNSDARIIAKYAKDWKVLVAIDNVHYYRNINAFDIVKDLSGQNNIRFFFTAREPEFRDFLREDKEFWKEKPELKKKVRTAMDKMENFEIEKLTEKEAEIFVKKYYEVVGKEITDEVIREKSQSYYEWSNEGDPLLFTFFLTGNGLKENVEYKYTNFIDNKIKEDIALFSCILESVGIEIKAEYIKTCLDLGDREYENAIRELVGKILYTEDKKKFRTRHPRWAIEYLKFRYEKEDELFRDELIEKLEDLTSALFDLNKEELAYNFISGLSGLLVYNKDLREFLAPSLKVPEFLSKDKKAELYAVDVGRFYYEIGDYNKAIECTDKAIELNPEYAEAYIVHGIAYYSKGELDLAINDFNVAIKLNPDLAEAYINRGIAYAEKGELDLAINDFNVAIKFRSCRGLW
ncbi:MAG: tetratricopeptide repeat protein [Methanosarcinales archaeon]